MFSDLKYKTDDKKALIMCNKLASCKEDVLRLEKILNGYGFDVCKKVECYPKIEIRKFLKSVKSEDLIYIHYSGHGIKRGKMIDGKYKIVSSWVNPDGSVVCSNEIDNILSQYNTQIIFTTDSCNSAVFADFYKGNSLTFIGTSKINTTSKTYSLNGEPVHGSLVYLFEYLIQQNIEINIENIEKFGMGFFKENKIDSTLIIKRFQ